jgi:hypothetical protein
MYIRLHPYFSPSYPYVKARQRESGVNLKLIINEGDIRDVSVTKKWTLK